MERKLICYCFGYTEEDMIRDVLENKGASTILARILNEKKKGHATANTITLKACDASQMSAVSRTRRVQR